MRRLFVNFLLESNVGQKINERNEYWYEFEIYRKLIRLIYIIVQE